MIIKVENYGTEQPVNVENKRQFAVTLSMGDINDLVSTLLAGLTNGKLSIHNGGGWMIMEFLVVDGVITESDKSMTPEMIFGQKSAVE